MRPVGLHVKAASQNRAWRGVPSSSRKRRHVAERTSTSSSSEAAFHRPVRMLRISRGTTAISRPAHRARIVGLVRLDCQGRPPWSLISALRLHISDSGP